MIRQNGTHVVSKEHHGTHFDVFDRDGYGTSLDLHMISTRRTCHQRDGYVLAVPEQHLTTRATSSSCQDTLEHRESYRALILANFLAELSVGAVCCTELVFKTQHTDLQTSTSVNQLLWWDDQLMAIYWLTQLRVRNGGFGYKQRNDVVFLVIVYASRPTLNQDCFTWV